jgi:hypothetical protein
MSSKSVLSHTRNTFLDGREREGVRLVERSEQEREGKEWKGREVEEERKRK